MLRNCDKNIEIVETKEGMSCTGKIYSRLCQGNCFKVPCEVLCIAFSNHCWNVKHPQEKASVYELLQLTPFSSSGLSHIPTKTASLYQQRRLIPKSTAVISWTGRWNDRNGNAKLKKIMITGSIKWTEEKLSQQRITWHFKES